MGLKAHQSKASSTAFNCAFLRDGDGFFCNLINEKNENMQECQNSPCHVQSGMS